jgi:excisionase family DNA binding protein
MEPLLTVAQVAEVLQLDEETVEQLITEKQLTGVLIVGNLRVKKEELEKFINKSTLRKRDFEDDIQHDDYVSSLISGLKGSLMQISVVPPEGGGEEVSLWNDAKEPRQCSWGDGTDSPLTNQKERWVHYYNDEYSQNENYHDITRPAK